jgi:hypothetical protein
MAINYLIIECHSGEVVLSVGLVQALVMGFRERKEVMYIELRKLDRNENGKD